MALLRAVVASALAAAVLASTPVQAGASPYSDAVMGTGGLVSYWRLGETSGTTAADQKGVNPGTYQPVFQLGQPGAVANDTDTSASFTGAGGHVNTPFEPGGTAGTIEFWGYATALDNRNAAVYNRGDGTKGYSHQVGLLANGRVKGYIADGARHVLLSPARAVRVNEWHHYALAWQNGDSVSLYLDGQLQDTEPIGTPYAKGDKFLLGAAGGPLSGLTNSWRGRLDEFAVYGTALTGAVIEEHYDLGKGSPPPPDGLDISAQPALFPAFDRGVSDYVSRCEPDSPVELSVTAPPGTTVAVDGQPAQGGTFTADVAVSTGQRFSFTVNSGGPSSTHHVRCLPQNFPAFAAERSGPTQTEWYIVTPSLGAAPQGTSPKYVAIFDSNGVPVWWMRSRGSTTPLDAKLLSNGNLAWLHLGRASSEEHALDGRLIRALATHGEGADHHDIQLAANGNYLMAKYFRKEGVDLTSCGGPANATITDNQIQEITPTGQLVWTWTASDHIPISEVHPNWFGVCNQGVADVYHFNSMEDDGDGLVISLRHEDAVYRIDKATGDVDWKLGGTTTGDSLAVVNDPAVTSGTGIFGGQHDARLYSDGTLTLHDNGTRRNRPPRSVRYTIDEGANTATLVEEVYDPDEFISNCCGGSRKLPAGNWVMSWGQNPFVTELTPAGDRVFKLTFTQGLFSYRANPVPFGTLSAGTVRGGMDTMNPR